MAVVLRFAADALVSCRFAISPVHETMSALRLLARPAAADFHAPWLRAITPVLERLDLTLLTPGPLLRAGFPQPATQRSEHHLRRRIRRRPRHHTWPGAR